MTGPQPKTKLVCRVLTETVLLIKVCWRLYYHHPHQWNAEEDASCWHAARMTYKCAIAIDGSSNSIQALKKGLELVPKDAHIYLVNFAEPIAKPDSNAYINFEKTEEYLEELGANILEASKDIALQVGIDADHVHTRHISSKGHAKSDFIKFCKHEGMDLIVAGTRGRGSLKRLVAGSFCNYLCQHAPCPVFVVKDAEPNPGPSEDAPLNRA